MTTNKTIHKGSDEKTGLSLSVVLLCYNEEGSIEETVQKCLDALDSFGNQYEIIIVDDGSTDSSPEIADRIQRECDSVRVIHNPINFGAGISIRIGWQAASCDIVLHNAMDYPFDLNDLDKVLPLFPDWDVVAISRNDRSAHSPYRKLTSLVNYLLLRLLFNVKLTDFNFVQAYKTEVVKGLSVKALSPAFVTPELLIRAQDKGFKITQIKTTFHPRKKGSPWHGKARDILWTLADMWSFWLERITRKE